MLEVKLHKYDTLIVDLYPDLSIVPGEEEFQMKFRKWFVLTIISGILSISMSASSVVRAEGYDWTGFYVGGHLGYAVNDVGGIFDSAGSKFKLDALDDEGLTWGGQAGYNFQDGRFVFGLEGDISISDLDNGMIDEEDDIQEFETDWFATIRGRAGYAYKDALFYATAGVAYMEAELRVEQNKNNSGPAKLEFDEWGGVLGAGIEYGITNNFSVKTEFQYLFIDDDDTTLRNPPLNDADTGDFIEVGDIITFMIGVNYRF